MFSATYLGGISNQRDVPNDNNDLVPNIVIPIAQKLPKNVDRHNTQARICLDVENTEDRFVKNRVPDVLRRIRVRGDLDHVSA